MVEIVDDVVEVHVRCCELQGCSSFAGYIFIFAVHKATCGRYCRRGNSVFQTVFIVAIHRGNSTGGVCACNIFIDAGSQLRRQRQEHRLSRENKYSEDADITSVYKNELREECLYSSVGLNSLQNSASLMFVVLV